MSINVITNCGCCGVQCVEQSCGICNPVTISGTTYDKIRTGYSCCQYRSSTTHECISGDGPPWSYSDCSSGTSVETECTSHVLTYMLITLPAFNLGISSNVDCPTCSICNFSGGSYILKDIKQYPPLLDINLDGFLEFNCLEFNESFGVFGWLPTTTALGSPYSSNHIPNPNTCSWGYYGYNYITSTGNCGSGGGCTNCSTSDFVGNVVTNFIRIVLYPDLLITPGNWVLRIDIGNIIGRYFGGQNPVCRICSGSYSCQSLNCKGVNTFLGPAWEGRNCPDCICGGLSPGLVDRCVQQNKYCGNFPQSVDVEIL